MKKSIVAQTSGHGIFDDRSIIIRKRPFEKWEEELLEETARCNKRITTPFLTLFRKKSARPVLQPWAHLMSILDNSYDGIAKVSTLSLSLTHSFIFA